MTTTVPPDVLSLLQRQGGVARRRDLHAAGLRRRTFERAVRSGDLVQLGGDVLSARAVADELTGLRAAVVGLAGAASGRSAALVWGIDLVELPAVHEVTVDRNRARAQWPGTAVRRRSLRPDDVTVQDGLFVTSPLRTVVDLLRDVPLDHAVAAADSALRRPLVTLEELLPAVADLPAARGRSRAVRAARVLDPCSGSVLESLFRVLVLHAGLPAPESQHRVRDATGRLIGRVDFAWPEHRLVVETDGFAFHADRASYREDRRRTNALVLAGWTVLRFSWEDVVETPDQVLAAVRSALLHAAA